MKYWQIALKSEPGNSYVENPAELDGQALMDGCEIGDGYILTAISMEEKDYLNLPEFTGF